MGRFIDVDSIVIWCILIGEGLSPYVLRGLDYVFFCVSMITCAFYRL